MIFAPFFLRVEFCLRQMYTKTVHGTLAIAKYVSGVFFVRFFDVSLRLPSVFSQQIIHHHIKIGIGPERFRFPLLSILSELMWFMGMISFARAPCFLHNNLVYCTRWFWVPLSDWSTCSTCSRSMMKRAVMILGSEWTFWSFTLVVGMKEGWRRQFFFETWDALREYLLRALWKEDFVTVSPGERFQLRTSSIKMNEPTTIWRVMIWRKESEISHWHYRDACSGQFSKCGCQDTNLHVAITFFGCLNHQAGNMHNFTSWYQASVLRSDAFKPWWDAWAKQIDFKTNRIEMSANVSKCSLFETHGVFLFCGVGIHRPY